MESRLCGSMTAVSGLIPDREGFFNKEFLSGLGGLNPKFLHSEYGMEAYVLLIAIRPSDRDVKPSGLLGAFEKSRLT